jgi:hypothetical protein
MRNNTHVFSYVQTYKTFLFQNRAEAWRRFMWQLLFFFFFFFIFSFCFVDCQKKRIVKFFFTGHAPSLCDLSDAAHPARPRRASGMKGTTWARAQGPIACALPACEPRKKRFFNLFFPRGYISFFCQSRYEGGNAFPRCNPNARVNPEMRWLRVRVPSGIRCSRSSI